MDMLNEVFVNNTYALSKFYKMEGKWELCPVRQKFVRGRKTPIGICITS